jgi:hypothetical protein
VATVTLKVEDEQRQLWVESAKKEGCSLSEWLRRAADSRAEGRSGALPGPVLGVAEAINLGQGSEQLPATEHLDRVADPDPTGIGYGHEPPERTTSRSREQGTPNLPSGHPSPLPERVFRGPDPKPEGKKKK